MRFLKDLFDIFVPNEKNGYKPHFFRVRVIVALGILITVIGVCGIVLQKTILENSEYLAAVISSAVVDFTNTDREAEHLQKLAINPVLERAAQLKAEDMASKSYFAHTSPEGLTPWHWFQSAGYDFIYAGENLAVRFYDSADVVRAWMNSPGHRANILNEHFTEIGIGVADGMFEGKPTVFVVQMFGAPAPAPIALAEETPLSAAEVTETENNEGTLVAGAETSAPIVEDTVALETEGTVLEEEEASSTPNVVFEDETFIAIKGIPATSSPAVPEVSSGSLTTLAYKFVTSPQSTVQLIYIVLAAIVGVALLVMVVVEMRQQHLMNASLGVLLLLLMAVFLYAGQAVVPGSLTVL